MVTADIRDPGIVSAGILWLCSGTRLKLAKYQRTERDTEDRSCPFIPLFILSVKGSNSVDTTAWIRGIGSYLMIITTPTDTTVIPFSVTRRRREGSGLPSAESVQREVSESPVQPLKSSGKNAQS